MESYDALVIGGGPAGAVAARTLALAGLRVAVADDGAGPARRKIGESLPGAAAPMLADLGLLEWLARSAPSRNVGNLSAWGGTALVATDFIRDPHGCGWHLDRTRFDRCLGAAAVEAGATWRTTRVREITPTGSGWHVMLGGRTMHARWLLDASGRTSLVPRRLGIERLHDEPLVALHAWGRNTAGETRTVVESVRDGWWYSAALPDGMRVASLHVAPSLAARLLREPHGWHEQLAQTHHVGRWCAPDDTWSRPRAADARGSWLAQPCGRNWLAVGDAALAFDPLSSQGLFNAIYTGLRAAQALMHALDQGVDVLPTHYGAQLAKVRAVYRQRVVDCYAMEQRWRDRPFWRLRRFNPM